ncbi:uridine kinase [Acanthopleuribacter pedis]|uniref:uridine/cytidine kinase n=1 Tax=Acanthopleuribacter pedis TaxID=442870 RepID=A0A8J7Q8S5_9BACT|nr:uridine kinase [Acanthopleuribacter pedis]
MKPSSIFIIGVAGGSGSGKTTFAHRLFEALGTERCCVLAQDAYYIDQSARFDYDGGSVNFDHPSSIDFDLMGAHLDRLKQGNTVNVPRYCFKSHMREAETTPMVPKAVVVVDGILVLSQPQVRCHFDTSVFLSIPEEKRFQHRLRRDVEERGRTVEGVHNQFFTQVKPMHDTFVEPSKNHAEHLITDYTVFDVVLSRVAAMVPR